MNAPPETVAAEDVVVLEAHVPLEVLDDGLVIPKQVASKTMEKPAALDPNNVIVETVLDSERGSQSPVWNYRAASQARHAPEMVATPTTTTRTVIEAEPFDLAGADCASRLPPRECESEIVLASYQQDAKGKWPVKPVAVSCTSHSTFLEAADVGSNIDLTIETLSQKNDDGSRTADLVDVKTNLQKIANEMLTVREEITGIKTSLQSMESATFAKAQDADAHEESHEFPGTKQTINEATAVFEETNLITARSYDERLSELQKQLDSQSQQVAAKSDEIRQMEGFFVDERKTREDMAIRFTQMDSHFAAACKDIQDFRTLLVEELNEVKKLKETLEEVRQAYVLEHRDVSSDHSRFETEATKDVHTDDDDDDDDDLAILTSEAISEIQRKLRLEGQRRRSATARLKAKRKNQRSALIHSTAIQGNEQKDGDAPATVSGFDKEVAIQDRIREADSRVLRTSAKNVLVRSREDNTCAASSHTSEPDLAEKGLASALHVDHDNQMVSDSNEEDSQSRRQTLIQLNEDGIEAEPTEIDAMTPLAANQSVHLPLSDEIREMSFSRGDDDNPCKSTGADRELPTSDQKQCAMEPSLLEARMQKQCRADTLQKVGDDSAACENHLIAAAEKYADSNESVSSVAMITPVEDENRIGTFTLEEVTDIGAMSKSDEMKISDSLVGSALELAFKNENESGETGGQAMIENVEESDFSAKNVTKGECCIACTPTCEAELTEPQSVLTEASAVVAQDEDEKLDVQTATTSSSDQAVELLGNSQDRATFSTQPEAGFESKTLEITTEEFSSEGIIKEEINVEENTLECMHMNEEETIRPDEHVVNFDDCPTRTVVGEVTCTEHIFVEAESNDLDSAYMNGVHEVSNIDPASSIEGETLTIASNPSDDEATKMEIDPSIFVTWTDPEVPASGEAQSSLTLPVALENHAMKNEERGQGLGEDGSKMDPCTPATQEDEVTLTSSVQVEQTVMVTLPASNVPDRLKSDGDIAPSMVELEPSLNEGRSVTQCDAQLPLDHQGKLSTVALNNIIMPMIELDASTSDGAMNSKTDYRMQHISFLSMVQVHEEISDVAARSTPSNNVELVDVPEISNKTHASDEEASTDTPIVSNKVVMGTTLDDEDVSSEIQACDSIDPPNSLPMAVSRGETIDSSPWAVGYFGFVLMCSFATYVAYVGVVPPPNSTSVILGENDSVPTLSVGDSAVHQTDRAKRASGESIHPGLSNPTPSKKSKTINDDSMMNLGNVKKNYESPIEVQSFANLREGDDRIEVLDTMAMRGGGNQKASSMLSGDDNDSQHSRRSHESTSSSMSSSSSSSSILEDFHPLPSPNVHLFAPSLSVVHRSMQSAKERAIRKEARRKRRKQFLDGLKNILQREVEEGAFI